MKNNEGLNSDEISALQIGKEEIVADRSFYLINLKAFYEHVVDLQNKDAKLKPFVNN